MSLRRRRPFELNISECFARITVLRLTPIGREPSTRMGSGPVSDFIRTSLAAPSRAGLRAQGQGVRCHCYSDSSSPSRATPEGGGLAGRPFWEGLLAQHSNEQPTTRRGGEASLPVAHGLLLWNEKVGG